MQNVNKYLALANYFKMSSQEIITLTFQDMENIIGFPLSPSAYNYVAYWHASKTHVFPNTWIDAGYKLCNLNIKNKTASFIKQSHVPSNVSDTPQQKLLSALSTNQPKINMDIDFAISNIKKYFDDIVIDINGRYKSWEHCHAFFISNRDKKNDEIVIDFLCLHLSFYLASWGMYRGSSFLLQKDYKVHRDAVIEILKDDYRPLWNVKCTSLLEDHIINLVFKVTENLKNIYIEKRKNIDGYTDVSNILITKILMGTFGCVPAYDRFFVSGIKTFKIASGIYNQKSIIDLAQFYIANEQKFEKCRMEISKHGLEYPQMKLIDMCFWKIAYDQSDKTAREKSEDI